MQVALSLPQTPESAETTFHIVPSEPVTLNWVGNHELIWPPQNGHTRFLLLRGYASDANSQGQAPTEWEVGLETRLDPLPAAFLPVLKNPFLTLDANFLVSSEAFRGVAADSTNAVAPIAEDPAHSISPETIAEYRTVCNLLESLGNRERELLVQYTPQSTVVKGIRERIATTQKLKKQLEAETPGLTHLKMAPMQSQFPESKP